MSGIGRWLNGLTILGGALWLAGLILHLQNPTFFSEIKLLFFFGITIITPMGVWLTLQPDRHARIPAVFRAAARLHLLTIIAIGIALLRSPGFITAILAGVWLLETLLLALYGLWRLLPRPVLAIEELCLDFGLLYLPISGLWFLAYSGGYALLTFQPSFVILTAVHFVFISLGALVIAGCVGRRLYGSRVWNLYRNLARVILVSPALVAAGITATQFSGKLLLEAGSTIILAGSFLMLALLCFSHGITHNLIAKPLIYLSCLSLLVTMSLALAYSLGRLMGAWSLSLFEMVRWHGWLNALGFTFCGLLAWNVINPVPQVSSPGIPFSRMSGRGRIGSDFFQRIEALDQQANLVPTGIVDLLNDYQQVGFDPALVAPAVAAFYEHTADHALLIYPEWRRGFRKLASVYKQISRRVEQMNFPLSPESGETQVSSTIYSLRDALDGRERVRAWVRVYRDTGQTVYAAAYSAHRHQDQVYMNIAFPLPLGNLTSILRLETRPEILGGLRLTSFSTRQGDQGVYFANAILPVRLPINETIEVYTQPYADFPPDFPAGEIYARHQMWLFGLHFLTLHYSITRDIAADSRNAVPTAKL